MKSCHRSSQQRRLRSWWRWVSSWNNSKPRPWAPEWRTEPRSLKPPVAWSSTGRIHPWVFPRCFWTLSSIPLRNRNWSQLWHENPRGYWPPHPPAMNKHEPPSSKSSVAHQRPPCRIPLNRDRFSSFNVSCLVNRLLQHPYLRHPTPKLGFSLHQEKLKKRSNLRDKSTRRPTEVSPSTPLLFCCAHQRSTHHSWKTRWPAQASRRILRTEFLARIPLDGPFCL